MRTLSFELQSIKMDGATVATVSGTNSNEAYTGNLIINGAGTTCYNVPIACLQGTTTPKRNLVGFICQDGVNTVTY
ncbi:MAG: hypothetical protein HQL02_12705 [Nitrospirae bacterium]|nr:hypothetical protein [Nitrospirota bacterium]